MEPDVAGGVCSTSHIIPDKQTMFTKMLASGIC